MLCTICWSVVGIYCALISGMPHVHQLQQVCIIYDQNSVCVSGRLNSCIDSDNSSISISTIYNALYSVCALLFKNPSLNLIIIPQATYTVTPTHYPVLLRWVEFWLSGHHYISIEGNDSSTVVMSHTHNIQMALTHIGRNSWQW